MHVICRDSFVKIQILMMLMILSACAPTPISTVNEPSHHDSGSSHEDNHSYSIRTNSERLINFGIRISNSSDDTRCEKGFIYMHSSVSAAEPSNEAFGFNRKSSPNIALYEWHMCFIVDGVTYKGWRGYDPGPNTSLRVSCFIPQELLSTHNDRYLCKTEETLHADADYSEYALHCWSKEACRRFETESDYNLFLRRGANNVALYRKTPSKDVRQATVNYEYFDDSQVEELRNSWIR